MIWPFKHAKWALTSCKWSYAAEAPLSGVITLHTTGRGPLCSPLNFLDYIMTPVSEQDHTVAALLFDSTKTSSTYAWSMFNANSHHHDHHPKRCRNIHTNLYAIQYLDVVFVHYFQIFSKSSFFQLLAQYWSFIFTWHVSKRTFSIFFFRGEHYFFVTFGVLVSEVSRFAKKNSFFCNRKK